MPPLAAALVVAACGCRGPASLSADSFDAQVAVAREAPLAPPVASSGESWILAAPPGTPEPADAEVTPRPPDPEAERVVVAWNRAMNQHDLHQLGALYAEHVDYHERSLSRAEVLAAKAKALAAGTFRQEIQSGIQMYLEPGGRVWTYFDERSGTPGHMGAVRAELILAPDDAGSFAITSESDELTNGNAPLPSCESAAAGVVIELSAVKRMLASGDALAADAGGDMGGIGPEEESGGAFTEMRGIHTEDHFEALVSWSVDTHGHLSAWTRDDGDLVIPARALRSIERACRR